MNTGAVKTALKALIEDNEATLISGLTAQGQSRTIAHVTTTVLTPAQGYFFVAIHQFEAAERTQDQMVNAKRPPRRTIHDVVIHVEDYAIGASGDDELFDAAHSTFDTFVDRIVTLIEEQNWIGTSPKYRLVRAREAESDRLITRSDSLQQWSDEAAQFHAMLYAQLRFNLEDCV